MKQEWRRNRTCEATTTSRETGKVPFPATQSRDEVCFKNWKRSMPGAFLFALESFLQAAFPESLGTLGRRMRFILCSPEKRRERRKNLWHALYFPLNP